MGDISFKPLHWSSRTTGDPVSKHNKSKKKKGPISKAYSLLQEGAVTDLRTTWMKFRRHDLTFKISTTEEPISAILLPDTVVFHSCLSV